MPVTSVSPEPTAVTVLPSTVQTLTSPGDQATSRAWPLALPQQQGKALAHFQCHIGMADGGFALFRVLKSAAYHTGEGLVLINSLNLRGARTHSCDHTVFHCGHRLVFAGPLEPASRQAPAVRRAVSPFWKRVMSVELRLSWPTGPVDSSGSPVDSSGPSVEGSGAVLSPGVKAQVTVHTALA